MLVFLRMGGGPRDIFPCLENRTTMKSLFTELRRRNVFRVGIAYLTAAWLILQVADTVLNNTAAPPWVMQVVMLVLAVGLAFAVFFAWAFEVTPEGIKREAEVDRGQSVTRAAGRKLNRAIIVLLVIALGYFVWEARFAERPMPADPPADAPGEADTSNRKSIAVLAFTDLSAEGDQEYFAHGVSEEILNDLAQIPGLRVTSRSSSFSFAGKDVDIPTVAAQLAVANVLEGSVRKAGSRIRITAQLIDARQDVHLWSATYDRELADIFAVQDEISAAIVLALQKHLGLAHGVVPRPVTAANAAAHEAYLRGRHLVVQNTDSATEAAMREFENAIELDPEYAIAYAELAIAATLQDLEAGGVPQAEVVAAAEPHVRRALSLNPNLAEAHAAAGLLEWRQSRPEHALTHLRRAVDINPNYVDVYVWMGNLLNFELGRYDEAFRMRSKAMRLDPLSIRRIGSWKKSRRSIHTSTRIAGERSCRSGAIWRTRFWAASTRCGSTRDTLVRRSAWATILPPSGSCGRYWVWQNISNPAH
jgi:TolB-like protein